MKRFTGWKWLAAGVLIAMPAWAASSTGAGQYQTSCAGCHGANLKGGPGPSLLHEGRRRSLAWLIVQIQNPTSHTHPAAMPSARELHLSSAQVKQIATYLSRQR